MSALDVKPMYGLFKCEHCQDDPGDDCGDSCAVPWPDEMPLSLEDDYQPACRCCGLPASLVTPLVPLT